METVKKGANWTVTVAYGSDKARHHGKYTAFATDRTTAIQQALDYFAKRNRSNRQIVKVQEWVAL